jgi:hypothetical protein
MEIAMARDNERRVFDLLPSDLQQSVRKQVAFGDSLFAFMRNKLGMAAGDNNSIAGEAATINEPSGRARKGSVTSSEFFKDPLLRILVRQPGHRMRAKDAIRAVIDEVRDDLKAVDFEKTGGTGVVRAENKVAFAREFLKRDGLIEEPSDDTRGLWILTPAGIRAAKKLK